VRPARCEPGRLRRGRFARSAGRGVAAQAALARRAYAETVLRGLTTTQQGRPVAQVRRLVKDALTHLGVRLTPDQYQQLAGDLTTGRTVTLP